VSGRCSPTEALNLLRRYSPIDRPISPMDAAKQLTSAIHDREKCHLWCNSEAVKPHIAPRLMVVAHENDGRWTASIVGTFAVGGVKPTDVWEFDVDEVVTLLPVRRGVKGVNWEIHATLEMERLGRKRALDMHNSGQLRSHLENVLQQATKPAPKDPKALASVIRAFLRGAN